MKNKVLLILAFGLLALTFQANAQRIINPDKNIVVSEHYEGGQEAMYKFFNDNLKYPPTALRNRIQGVNIVKFKLAADGQIQDVQVVKNVGGGCGEEARRLVEMLKFNPPGYDVNVSIPLNFKVR